MASEQYFLGNVKTLEGESETALRVKLAQTKVLRLTVVWCGVRDCWVYSVMGGWSLFWSLRALTFSLAGLGPHPSAGLRQNSQNKTTHP